MTECPVAGYNQAAKKDFRRSLDVLLLLRQFLFCQITLSTSALEGVADGYAYTQENQFFHDSSPYATLRERIASAFHNMTATTDAT